jgi:hypothetical protein
MMDHPDVLLFMARERLAVLRREAAARPARSSPTTWPVRARAARLLRELADRLDARGYQPGRAHA